MGCLMSHEYFVLQINGQPTSIHRRYEDAVRVGLVRRYQTPQDDIKVFQISSTEEVKQDTVLH
jgi:hypothetical protein